jgi:hypothetical protein
MARSLHRRPVDGDVSSFPMRRRSFTGRPGPADASVLPFLGTEPGRSVDNLAPWGVLPHRFRRRFGDSPSGSVLGMVAGMDRHLDPIVLRRCRARALVILGVMHPRCSGGRAARRAARHRPGRGSAARARCAPGRHDALPDGRRSLPGRPLRRSRARVSGRSGARPPRRRSWRSTWPAPSNVPAASTRPSPRMALTWRGIPRRRTKRTSRER